MSPWRQLTTSALLGTRHQSPQLTAVAAPLQPLVARSLGPLEHQLLLAAGMQTLYAQTGEQAPPPPADTPSTFEAPAETHQALSKSLTHILRELLDGSYAILLPELLDAVHQQQLAVPAVLLPDLLRSGEHNHRRHLAIARLLGPRGRWLAAQNPDWQYAISPTLPQSQLHLMWSALPTSKKIRRLELLRQLAPTKASLLLRREWRRQADSTRAMLLKGLSETLSMADEPFLEAALDDRNVNVRRRAAEMLASLPQSRYAQRMIGHHADVFQMKQLLTPAIHVQFPEVLTPAMQRDGITRQNERRREAYISRRLILMLGATPLDHWSARWDLTPEKILQAAHNSGWTRTLLTGFANAARRQKRADWGLLLLDEDGLLTSRSTLVRILQPQHLPALLKLAEARLAGWMPLTRTNPLTAILKEWPHVWPAETAEFFTTQLIRHIQADSAKAPDPTTRSLLSRFLRHIPPEMGPAVADRFRSAIPVENIWRKTLQNSLNMLSFRVTMHQALAASVPPTRGN